MNKPKYSVVVVKESGCKTERYFKTLEDAMRVAKVENSKDTEMGKTFSNATKLMQVKAGQFILRSYGKKNDTENN